MTGTRRRLLHLVEDVRNNTYEDKNKTWTKMNKLKIVYNYIRITLHKVVAYFPERERTVVICSSH